MENYIVIAILVVIVGAAVAYLIHAKKSGKKCVGCPDGCCSAKKDGGSCCCGKDKK